MQLARARTDDGVVTGEYHEGGLVTDDDEYGIDEEELLPPCEPTALYCVGRNYAATLEQMSYERPEEPDFFIKPAASLLGHGDPIAYPPFTTELTYAGELAAVVDVECRDVAPDAVSDVVRGYTV